MTLRLNACPRCKGAVQRDSDHYGPYDLCVICGWQKSIPKKSKWRDASVVKRKAYVGTKKSA